MPIIRSIFNFDHPWLDFNILALAASADSLCYMCEVGIAYGCLYQLAPWVCLSFADLATTRRYDKIATNSLRITHIAMLGWSVFNSKLSKTSDLSDMISDPPSKVSDQALGRPWLNKYFEGSLIPTAYFCSFMIPIAVQASLACYHPLLPAISSAVYLGMFCVDQHFTFIPWRRFTMMMTVPLYRFFINPERKRIACEKSSLSSGFLGIGRAESPFQYQPLASANFIRLLKLKLEKSNPTQATCDLVEVHVDHPPPYDAISYRWSTTPFDQTFHLRFASSPGTHIALSKPVYDILQALTPMDGERLLWIDSICINQEDASEKSGQISLMGKVYGNADRVIVCLASQPEDSSIVSFLCRTLYFYFLGGESSIATNTLEEKFPVVVDRRFAPNKHDIAATHSLLNNDYFNRVWIIQECVLAKNIDLLIGRIPVSWNLLMYSVSFLMRQENFVIASIFNESFGLLRTSTAAGLLVKLSELRINYREKGQISLFDLFVWNHIAQATDPRDKVYGLLGLCPRADIDAIHPSYEKSVKTVYTDIVCYALRKGSYLPFSMSGLTYHEAGSQILDWPSWLPTFSKISESFNTSDYHDRTYRAGSNLLPDWKVTSTGHVLRLRGILVDTICDKSSDFDRLDDARKLVQDPLINFTTHNMSAVADMQDLFQRHSSKAQFQAADRKEAFWRTITDDFDLCDLSGQAERIAAVEKELASWKYGDRSELMADSFCQLNAGSIVNLNMRQLHEQGLYKQGLTINSEAFSVLGSVPLQGRPFAITNDKKLFASVPMGTQVGDIVVIFNGAPAPCILRCAGDEDGCYYIVGEAYVNGIMHGEAMEDGKARWFDLR